MIVVKIMKSQEQNFILKFYTMQLSIHFELDETFDLPYPLAWSHSLLCEQFWYYCRDEELKAIAAAHLAYGRLV